MQHLTFDFDQVFDGQAGSGEAVAIRLRRF